MKLNSKLWMLAVAMATVGCQDDLGNDPNNGGGEEFNGPSTFMNIAVNAGLETRAERDDDGVDPTGGEEGDGEEAGSLEESDVKDVTVILFKGANASGSGNPTGLYDLNTGNANEIAGVGYVSNNGMVTDGTYEHLWASTVKVKIVDTDQWEGQTFGVLAITNLGDGNGDGEGNFIYKGIIDKEITTVQELANKIIPDYKTSQGFVMSTHTLQWGSDQSLVTLDANATEDNAPTVEVFVERLAAKIRINDAAPLNATSSKPFSYLGNYVYGIGGDRVVLQNGAVVNQLTSGSYLLKRVTKYTSGVTADINDPTVLLGNERADNNGAGLNFIIEPWSKVKTAPYTDYSTLSSDNGTALTYANHFEGADYATLWGQNIVNAGGSRFALNNNSAAVPQMTLCYTMENTTSREAQKNGYSTGILFQAQYFPAKWTAVIAGDKTGSVDIDYDSTKDGVQTYDEVAGDGGTPESHTFYVKPAAKQNPAGDRSAIAYENYEAILAGFLNDMLMLHEDEVSAATNLTISKFEQTAIDNLKVSDFNASPVSSVVDPFGYIDYLKERAAVILAERPNDPTFDLTDSFQDFQKSADFDGSDYLVYTGGVCYYPFWIRHANNNNPTQEGSLNEDTEERMGISEFAIVRNNLYDVTVSRIEKLGLAGSEVPDPDKDDETSELFLFVNLHVKNWVLRENSAVLY